MESGTLIRKIHMECPLCDRTHEIEERKRNTMTIIKGDEITYEERFYFCANADEEENEFEDCAMVNENLLNARNAYRIKHNLLTSDQIVEIRQNYGLSQVDLARLLGWGEATISRYESKAIQDEAYDMMLRTIFDNPLNTLELLNKNSDKFTELKRLTIKNRIIEKLNSYGKEFLTRQTFQGEYVIFDEPSDSNGYTVLNIDKIEAAISYFAEQDSDLIKTKLMRLLWYADALSFIQHQKAITGMVYRHESMGALPIGHYSLMNLKNLNIQEEISPNYDSVLHVYPNKNLDYSVLGVEDKAVLDIVIAKFKNFKAADIVNYMHEEKAYTETSSGDIIPFSLAKEIRTF